MTHYNNNIVTIAIVDTIHLLAEILCNYLFRQIIFLFIAPEMRRKDDKCVYSVWHWISHDKKLTFSGDI